VREKEERREGKEGNGTEGKKKGRKVGREKGKKGGKKEGRKEERKQGRKEKRKEGRMEGRKEERKEDRLDFLWKQTDSVAQAIAQACGTRQGLLTRQLIQKRRLKGGSVSVIFSGGLYCVKGYEHMRLVVKSVISGHRQREDQNPGSIVC
jgi:hypothetical protein